MTLVKLKASFARSFGWGTRKQPIPDDSDCPSVYVNIYRTNDIPIMEVLRPGEYVHVNLENGVIEVEYPERRA